MKTINRIFTVVHILPWAVFAGGVAWDILVFGNSVLPNIYLAVLLSGLYVFYGHLFILKRYLNERNYKAYLPALIVILFTAPFLFRLFINMNDPHYQHEWFSMALASTLVFLTVSFLIRIAQNIIIKTLQKEELRQQAMRSELDYLKSQINPHFLFNTLNNIHTLVYTQHPLAPDAVMRLSSLMRYMIYESNSATVPLSLEIDYMQGYIGLQQLRYQTPGIVDFKVEGAIENLEIAPLLCIHLLENTYKHSPAKLQTGDIQVRIFAKKNEVSFSFQNPVGNKNDNLPEEQGGMGLANVAKRLQMLYPGKHKLHINEAGGVYRVELKIRIQQPKYGAKTELLHH